jgi:hypothetical protein
MSARWPITFPIQMVGIHVQKVPKPTHYLSGFSQKPIPTPLPLGEPTHALFSGKTLELATPDVNERENGHFCV